MRHVHKRAKSDRPSSSCVQKDQDSPRIILKIDTPLSASTKFCMSWSWCRVRAFVTFEMRFSSHPMPLQASTISL